MTLVSYTSCAQTTVLISFPVFVTSSMNCKYVRINKLPATIMAIAPCQLNPLWTKPMPSYTYCNRKTVKIQGVLLSVIFIIPPAKLLSLLLYSLVPVFLRRSQQHVWHAPVQVLISMPLLVYGPWNILIFLVSPSGLGVVQNYISMNGGDKSQGHRPALCKTDYPQADWFL